MEIEIEEIAIYALLEGMVRAWNAGSGVEFADFCEEDADFVNIYGTHARGRREIARGHEQIFRTIYAGSTLHYHVAGVRFLSDDIAVVHVEARLEVPRGPLAGERRSVPSMVMRRRTGEWRIASFQNTLIADTATKN